ncbi:hypothetical protein DFQ26_004211 [Actinomortierella ambigua]|nr:hypothetical protein DFQ26_004211 [Actinomortierella ambigua]
MTPSSKAWIRSRMAAIRKVSGIAFSDDIFLSILICLIAKNKHLVLHTHPDLVPELKTVTEQHCAVVYGLTTATIVCHDQQTRQDIIGAITGRHSDIVSHTASSSAAHYQFPSNNTIGGGTSNTALGGYAAHGSLGQGQMYQYSNPGDDFLQQRHVMMRYEKSRRSIATTHSGISEYSLRPSEKYAQSIRTMNGRDQKSFEDMSSMHYAHRHSTISANIDPDDQDSAFKRRSSLAVSPPANSSLLDPYPIESLRSQEQSISRRPLHYGAGYGGNLSTAGGSTAQVTPMDFTFTRRRHESVSLHGTYNTGNEPSGVTYSGRRLAQAIILDGLENASQEVYAILLEMIITKEINDRNRYLLPDLIVIAVFNTPKVPSNIPKQLDWDELAKRMKRVTVSNDMMRYIRDIVVGIRTHVDVDGGLTPRASQDLVTVVKTLAAIFQTSYVTPDLLIIATEKVISHRLELKADKRTSVQGAHAGGQSSLYSGSGASSATSLPRFHSRVRSPMRVSPNHPYGHHGTPGMRAGRSSKVAPSHTSLEADDEDTGEDDNKSFIEKSDDGESLSSFVEKSGDDEDEEQAEEQQQHIEEGKAGRRASRPVQQHQRLPANREYASPGPYQHAPKYPPHHRPYASHDDHRHEVPNEMEHYEPQKSPAEIIREVLDAVYPPI